MATKDREHWDGKYLAAQGRPSDEHVVAPALPERFEAHATDFASASTALEIACGEGTTAVWLRLQGVQVEAFDISPVAISAAKDLADAHGVSDLCNFATHDFDQGLPPCEPADLVVCHLFRDASLDDAIIDRLRPGALLAIAALSEVGAGPGPFRVTPGALPAAFSSLEVLAAGEGDGVAWLLARKP